MSTEHIIVIALVQGITEFLPISSSSHLILIPALTGWPDNRCHGAIKEALLLFKPEITPEGQARDLCQACHHPGRRLQARAGKAEHARS